MAGSSLHGIAALFAGRLASSVGSPLCLLAVYLVELSLVLMFVASELDRK